MAADGDNPAPPIRKISVFGRDFRMPRSRGARIAIGTVLVILGIFGFLPILGFWMVPLGLLILSYEFAYVRRARRRFVVWWERRRAGKRSQ
ncbi:PGPGW domain-containing protein [Mesorhizobium sp. A623]